MRRIIVITALFLGGISVCAPAGELSESVLHPASYWEKREGGSVQCLLCPRKCAVPDGRRGFCTVRVNKSGSLYTLGYANPVAVHIDPIEKKPFFHVSPGSEVYSLAVAGCNMRCVFCQNWQISQSSPDQARGDRLYPEEAVEQAVNNGCRFIAYTYTEPTVFYEYMIDIARIAKSRGIRNTMHTCGYINRQPLEELLKYMDAVNVDLKGFSGQIYSKIGQAAELGPVLDTLKTIKNSGVWLEVTCLIIPNLNDDPSDIRRMCEWIRQNLGEQVPVHFSRFVPAFQLANLPPTPLEKLEEAYNIAKSTGLQYVYIGNVPGHPGESTYCPVCGNIVVRRAGYRILENKVKGGKCPFCGNKIAGKWDL